MKTESLFNAVKRAGLEYASHETDLYLPDTQTVRDILAAFPTHKANATRFFNQITKTIWLDVPFAYDPAWRI